MNQFWSDIVHDLSPYIPGEQPKTAELVKLNTNENPYGPSPEVLSALQLAVSDTLRLYPDPESKALKQSIADYFQINTEQVFVGNGSDEVLAHIFHGLLKHDKPILYPEITYSFYPVYCKLYQVDYETIPLAEDFSINLEDYQRENGGVIFPNPNAPTGRLLSLSEIEDFLQVNTQSVVVIDEAYIDFGGKSAVTLIDKYHNLLVTQTFSKSRSLAGLRIGYALGNPGLIEALVRVKDSFNSYPLDRLAEAAGIAAMNDKAYFNDCCEKVIKEREFVTQSLQELGFTIIPSAANFVFASHPSYQAADIAAELRERKVIVRHFKQPKIAQYLRISIGTHQENQQLLAALDTIV
jgi:histidinol-phosphate aminotransferase